MHDCLLKTKLLPKFLIKGSDCLTPGIPLAGSVIGNVAWTANTVRAANTARLASTTRSGSTYSANTNWPGTACLTGTKRLTHTNYPANTKWSAPTAWPAETNCSTYADRPINMHCSSINPGSNCARSLKPIYSDVTHPQPISIAPTSLPKNTSDNRVTCILIATLILVALDLIFLR